jgi:superkiller protein 3
MIEANENQLLQARIFWDEGKIDESTQLLSLILSRKPDFGKALAFQGWLFYKYYVDYTNAEDSFKKALRTAPDYPELYLNYGEFLIQLERYNEAIAVLNKGMEVPCIDKYKAHRLFGMLYERQKEWDEAIASYTKSIQYTFLLDEMEQSKYDLNRIAQKRNL